MEVNFNRTNFYKNLKDDLCKIIINFECLIQIIENELTLSFYIGLDKLYKINDIEEFLRALESGNEKRFGKNFILEPSKMAFYDGANILIEFLQELKDRRELLQKNYSVQNISLKTNSINLIEEETERFLDRIWVLNVIKSKQKIYFSEDFELDTSIQIKDEEMYLIFDYTKYGDFKNLTVNFKYIFTKKQNKIIKLSNKKIEIIKNIYPLKNEQNKVCIKIEKNDMQKFKKNFYNHYKDEIKILIPKDIKKEIETSKLISRVYFDIAVNGIVSKVEFVYDNKEINPLDDNSVNLISREYESEKKVLNQLKNYGFQPKGKLYSLEDLKSIVYLLTDKMKELKKISEVYYSQDFKKLHVNSITNISMGITKDDSIIHMNINLENVSDDELVELFESIKKGKKYFRLRNGAIVDLTRVDIDSLSELLNNLDIHKVKDGAIEIPLNRALYIDNYLKGNSVKGVNISENLEKFIDNIISSKNDKIEINENINGILRKYQKVGVKWLKTMANSSLGGILADDMGLGKTLQVLAFLNIEQNSKSIVIAPKSLLYNWSNEAKKFTPELKTCIINGNRKNRENLIKRYLDYDLLITSYGSIKNDIDLYKDILFTYIFIDEAQNIKNPMTLNANSVKELKSKCSFALTGTPMENRLLELWSIFDFIMPGYLFDMLKFKNTFELPIIRDLDKNKSEQLLNMIKPFILRRLKKEVLDELPEKTITNCVIEMSDEQKKLYMAYYKDFKNELDLKLERGGFNNIEVLALIIRLRQICAHPKVFIESYNHSSCKIDMALEIINKSIASGQSVLLFSQFIKILYIMQKELENQGISYHYLDGSLTAEERNMVIENFNSDGPSVFLISLKAGGTGLNLTKANVVIHFEPWWNPAVESQASDRVYRIGQKNPVQIYKLIAQGSIEEKIIELQNSKQNLSDEIIKSGESFLNTLTADEIKKLFSVTI